eukprot:comp17291_c0_seq1/m.16417 comp17291_c0_seq1/g.16417  ORF comp17291_c0_seq1/g.16417 comp17291_c0_seq1/m.16417 type:complete len:325 (-) comp17291_c0_seq1:356-1330(-)
MHRTRVLAVSTPELGTRQMAEKMREIRQKRELRESTRELRQREKLHQLDMREFKSRRMELDRQRTLELFVLKSEAKPSAGNDADSSLHVAAVHDLRDETETAKEANERLKAEKMDLRARVEDLRDRLEDESEAWEMACHALALKRKQLEAVRQNMQAATQQFEKDLAELQAKLAEPLLPDRDTLIEMERQEMETLEAMQSRKAALKEEVEQLQKSTDEQREGPPDSPKQAPSSPPISEHTERLSQLEAQIRDEEQHIVRIKKEIEASAEQRELSVRTTDRLEKQVKTLGTEKIAARATVRTLDIEIGELRSERDRLKDKLSRLA